MNVHRTTLLIFLLIMSAVSANSQRPSTADERELLRLQNAWAEARIKGDVAFLEKLYAKEFRITAMNGNDVSRESDIGVFASGAMKPETIKNEEMMVSVYGDTAVIRGIEKVKGKYKGNPGDFVLRFTNVYVRRGGRWQMILHHSTEVREKNKLIVKAAP